MTELKPNDRVRDREERNDTLRVIGVTTDRAKEWFIDEIDLTVAEANPDYPNGDRVVIAKYETEYQEYDDGSIVTKSRLSAKAYAFPESRLEKVD